MWEFRIGWDIARAASPRRSTLKRKGTVFYPIRPAIQCDKAIAGDHATMWEKCNSYSHTNRSVHFLHRESRFAAPPAKTPRHAGVTCIRPRGAGANRHRPGRGSRRCARPTAVRPGGIHNARSSFASCNPDSISRLCGKTGRARLINADCPGAQSKPLAPNRPDLQCGTWLNARLRH